MSYKIGQAQEATHCCSSWSTDIQYVADVAVCYTSHLLRLTPDCRRARFGSFVSDNFIRAYGDRFDCSNSLVLGCYREGEMRASVELRSLSATWGSRAEIAFSTEKPWRRGGMATALLCHALAAARRLTVQELFLTCHAYNRPMVCIAERAASKLDFCDGECFAKICVDQSLNPDVAVLLSDEIAILNVAS